MLQMAATMADILGDPNTKIRNPDSSLLNFKNHLANIQDSTQGSAQVIF
jgi:hypothetical protein